MTGTTSELTGGPTDHAPPPLVVAVTEEQSTWVIHVQGELDLFTFPLVKQHLDAYKIESGNGRHPRRIVYSLPELQFIDASGLRALLTSVDGHGPGTITIRNPSSIVRRLLELVDLESMIEPHLEPTKETAKRGLQTVSSAFVSIDLLKYASEAVVYL